MSSAVEVKAVCSAEIDERISHLGLWEILSVFNFDLFF